MKSNQLTQGNINTQNKSESKIVSELWGKHFGDKYMVGLSDPKIDGFFDELSKALPPLTTKENKK